MMTATDYADRAPTQQELADAVAKAHLLRSHAFRDSVYAVVAFFRNLVPTNGSYLTHGRLVVR